MRTKQEQEQIQKIRAMGFVALALFIVCMISGFVFYGLLTWAMS